MGVALFCLFSLRCDFLFRTLVHFLLIYMLGRFIPSLASSSLTRTTHIHKFICLKLRFHFYLLRIFCIFLTTILY
ncbi:hypothetical protein RCL_jg11125.t1 [Rhizophagus clarus]|uniref:Uncharacterized protein n=1 Tax=Rhizophagus clarus TaxID=94130 RepID=A0A8H3MBE1_9GLOM|nr:hypothetical protein RCL_jg11125.t1 [Rhizophagus clarus]